jgi:hypothetical protein
MALLDLIIQAVVALIIGFILAILIIPLFQRVREMFIKKKIPETMKKEVLDEDARQKNENVRYPKLPSGTTGSDIRTETGRRAYGNAPRNPTNSPETQEYWGDKEKPVGREERAETSPNIPTTDNPSYAGTRAGEQLPKDEGSYDRTGVQNPVNSNPTRNKKRIKLH